MKTESFTSGATVFTTFCLGTGCMAKCRTCLHDKNWQTLNEMPDTLRKSMQANMKRINESHCQITHGSLYVPINAPK